MRALSEPIALSVAHFFFLKVCHTLFEHITSFEEGSEWHSALSTQKHFEAAVDDVIEQYLSFDPAAAFAFKIRTISVKKKDLGSMSVQCEGHKSQSSSLEPHTAERSARARIRPSLPQ